MTERGQVGVVEISGGVEVVDGYDAEIEGEGGDVRGLGESSVKALAD